MHVIGSVCVSDLSLDTWVNSSGHLELLIDFSCDHRGFGDGRHAMTHPEEQTCVCVFVEHKRGAGDTWLCGPHSGFGWSISGSSEIFIYHGIFTNNRAVDLFINE